MPKMQTRTIEMTVGQIEKIIAALNLLPPEADKGEFYTERPQDLTEMLQHAIDDLVDGIHCFIA